MELSRELPGDHLFIRAVDERGIQVKDEWYRTPLILTGDSVANWAASRAEEFSEEQFLPLLDLQPEVVLLGTGPRQVLLPPELMMVFYARGTGFEAMDTRAACRTFNILVGEGRKVVAGLLPP